jgi:uncharacterized protein GlcG (DUF336 family)
MLMATMPHVMHVSNEDKIGSAGPDHAARSAVKPGGSIMSMRVRLFATLVATCALPSWSSAQVITHRDVGVRMGLAIAVAALDQCEADGNSVSVAVVDRAGRLRVFLQGDNANPHNLELARRKAYTARTFGRTSAEWAKRTADLPELAAQRELADVIALRGGVPIKVGNETIGAVGVSGSSSAGDEKCAMAGIAKVTDQLR